MVNQRLNFTGRSDVEASFRAWCDLGHSAWDADDLAAMLHAAQMRDRMARALREGE